MDNWAMDIWGSVNPDNNTVPEWQSVGLLTGPQAKPL